LGALGNADAPVVQEGATAFGGGKQVIAGGIVHHGLFDLAAHGQRNADAINGQAVDKVGGAVQRIDDPDKLRVLGAFSAARFFGPDTVAGVGRQQGFNDCRFCCMINFGHEVVGIFLRHAHRFDIQRGAVDDRAGGASSLHGHIDHGVQIKRHKLYLEERWVPAGDAGGDNRVFYVLLMKTRFILLQPSHAGNVGAVARAMKTMGFDDLVLVAPRWANVLRREETIQRSSGALDVLEKCRIVETLDDALDGMTHLCATAMTPRDFGPPTTTPRLHFAHLRQEWLEAEAAGDAAVPVQQGVAFLFGSERFGMRNEDVYRCHVCLSIPSNPKFGSLNIAAALQLIAYEWRLALGGFAAAAPVPAGPAAADAAQIAGLLAHWEQALVAVGFLDPAVPRKLMPRLNALLNRANITPEEVHILRGIAKAVLQRAGD